MSKLQGQKVTCIDRPDEIGIISYYDPYNGEINIKYSDSDILITHISRCKIVTV